MFVNCFIKLLVLAIFWTSQVKSVPQQERIITNPELIYGNQGVAVKFWYNETKILSNQLTSVPGCPKSINGIPWIYYGDPARCYLAGYHGPCPLGQKLLLKQGSTFGLCACECVVDGIKSGLLKWKKTKDSRYISCESSGENANQLGQIFDQKTNTCYEKATQGPCLKGEILIGATSNKLGCLPICKRGRGKRQVIYGEYSVCMETDGE